MICDGCKHEAGRLAVTSDGDFCRHCLKREIPGGANLHISAGNKHSPNMTQALKMHIKTRHIGKDGFVHSHWKYETKDW